MTDAPETPPGNAPDNTALSTTEFEAAHKAILSAYSKTANIEIRVRLKWGLRLNDWVDLGGPRREQIHRLLEWTEDEGSTRELIALLWSERPGNDALNALARALLPDLQSRAAKYADQSVAALTARAPQSVEVADRGALEAEVSSRSRLVTVGGFEAAFDRARDAVCRIEAGGALGTGFLIGPSTVLTNYHVIQSALEDGLGGDQVLCRFDVLKDGDEGVAHPGRAEDWLGPRSAFSASDTTGDGAPRADQLDFAVIHLAQPVDPARKPLRLSDLAPVVAPLDVAVILQHPQGDAMRIALGSVVEFPADGLRYRYNVTTRPGSSGSPVFSATLSLIGLHHAADPATRPTYNQAVPIWRIAREIKAQGLALDAL